MRVVVVIRGRDWCCGAGRRLRCKRSCCCCRRRTFRIILLRVRPLLSCKLSAFSLPLSPFIRRPATGDHRLPHRIHGTADGVCLQVLLRRPHAALHPPLLGRRCSCCLSFSTVITATNDQSSQRTCSSLRRSLAVPCPASCQHPLLNGISAALHGGPLERPPPEPAPAAAVLPDAGHVLRLSTRRLDARVCRQQEL